MPDRSFCIDCVKRNDHLRVGLRVLFADGGATDQLQHEGGRHHQDGEARNNGQFGPYPQIIDSAYSLTPNKKTMEIVYRDKMFCRLKWGARKNTYFLCLCRQFLEGGSRLGLKLVEAINRALDG